MGCLMVGLSALLALVVPASIARSSLVGAYVVIAMLTIAAVTAVVLRSRPAPADGSPRTGAVAGIGVLTALYVTAVTLIHVTR